MKKIYRSAFAVLTLFIINICFITGYYSVSLPDSFYVSKGSSLKLSTKFSIEASGNETVASFAGDTAPSVETANLKLFGLIPVKSVEIHTVETPVLIPGGEPFGIKLLMEGVMVVGMGEIKTSDGMVCPAEECGVKEGSVILSLDGKKLSSNNDITEIVSNSDGRPLEIVYTDGGNETVSVITPVYSVTDCCYKA